MTFGERLNQLRIQQRLTLSELAQRVGVSEATIQRYESGNIKNPPMDRIDGLARALNVPQAMLMGWDEAQLDTDLRLLARDMQNLPEKKKQRIIAMVRLMLEDEEE